MTINSQKAIAMGCARDTIQEIALSSASRSDLWVKVIKAIGLTSVAEVGVFRGDFSENLLHNCPSISRYYMIDSWRKLESWNKPANVSDERFARFFEEAKAKTDFAAEKRVILRGKTTEVVDKIPNESLDFVYIDADHTLKGITIDLNCLYPKVRKGGWIGGDDFSETIWQHDSHFEPTLVFPYAVYFSEAIGSPIFGLPFRQFLIHKESNASFSFIDFTGNYERVDLHSQFIHAGAIGEPSGGQGGAVRRVARGIGRRFISGIRIGT